MATGTGWVRRIAAYQAVVSSWPDSALLACSGGVDSSALLVLAGMAVLRGDIEQFPVVYVDHLTRAESAADGDSVESLTGRFGLRFERTTVSPDDAATASTSTEDRLRLQRYAALARVMRALGCDSIVTAHTRDDQVETVLMRLLTGAGGAALAGMDAVLTLPTPAGDIEVHRPLLGTSRAELQIVLERANVVPRIDPSNSEPIYRRNRLRHEVVPLLGDVFPGFDGALLRVGTIVARDADALDAIAAAEVEASVSTCDHGVVIDRHRLRSLHPAIASRVIRETAGRLMPENQREFSFERAESVRVAAAGRTGAVIELPYGVVARIERSAITIERRNF